MPTILSKQNVSQTTHTHLPNWKILQCGIIFSKYFAKGSLTGLGLYAALQIIQWASKRGPHRLKTSHFLNKSSICLSLFLGLYPAMYNVILYILDKFWDHKDGWGYCVAGGIAGLSIVVEIHSRQKFITLFAIGRALDIINTFLVGQQIIPAIPLGSTWLFCLSCAVIYHGLVYHPEHLDTAYYHANLKWSRFYTDRKIEKLYRTPSHQFIPCHKVGLHPEGSCMLFEINDLPTGWIYSAKIYMKMYLLQGVFRWKVLLSQPLTEIRKLLVKVVQSANFLTGLMAFTRIWFCLLRNLHEPSSPLPLYITLLTGTLSPLAILFERPSRRKELALFVLMQAMNSVYLKAVDYKWVGELRYTWVFCFAISMMSLMHAYETKPKTLPSFISGILTYLTGYREKSQHQGMAADDNGCLEKLD